MFTKNERLCPDFKKPCIKERCEAWHQGVVEADVPGAMARTQAHSACMKYFWIPLYLKGIGARVDGSQRATEEMRNEFAKGGLASYEAIREVAVQIRQGLESRQRPALEHNG